MAVSCPVLLCLRFPRRSHDERSRDRYHVSVSHRTAFANSICPSSPDALDSHPSTPLFTEPSDSLPALSDDEVRSLIEQYIQAAPWFHEHAQESLVGEEGVPTCALQLAPKGESVYRCFVVPGKSKKNKPMFKCATCEYTSDRLHRVVGHQRIKRNHKPFVCGDVGW